MSDLERAVDWLRAARAIVVFTGAGISAESGIPTFRDALTGHWARFDPADLATPRAYARNPEFVGRWYDERRCAVAACRPNAGHAALARLERIARDRGASFTLITQNVDRLHQAAGSSDVIELHGSLWVWRCVDCGAEREERGPAFATCPPLCECGGMRRPGVVWFGESLPAAAFGRAQQATAACDLFVSVGTSSVVYPAAGLIEQAIAGDANVVEVNIGPTAMSDRACAIRGKSGKVLPRWMDEAFGKGT